MAEVQLLLANGTDYLVYATGDNVLLAQSTYPSPSIVRADLQPSLWSADLQRSLWRADLVP